MSKSPSLPLPTVTDWRKTGRHLRVKASNLDASTSAFKHPLIDETSSLSK